MVLVPAHRPTEEMSVDQISATVEYQRRAAAKDDALRRLSQGKITAPTARRVCEEADAEFRAACSSGLHYDI
jgi:hypothetical protein